MQAAQIRDKYKRILEEPEQEDSDDEWQIAYSQMNKHRKKKILTESSVNVSSTVQNDKEAQTLNLKQKLAQCLSNCKQHCNEIERLKREQLIFQDQKVEWQQESSEYSKIIEEQRNTTKTHLGRIRQLQNENRELQMKCQEIMMERELQQKQAEFYKAELSQLQVQLEKKEKQFKLCEKEYRSFEKVKKDNEYLKSDVERLGNIIDDSLRFGRVSGELMKKHFLGKPHREMEFWYPQQLVGEVEHFLKKNQVGHGNKDFTANLIKFIDKIQEKSKEEPQKGPNAARNSSSKQKDRDCLSLKKTNKLNIMDYSNKKHSYNLSSMRDDHLLRSNTNSFWKANESRVIPSSSTMGISAVKNLCWDVVNEFRSVVFELLLEKEVKRKKIKKLIDSMSSSLMELFQSNQSFKEFSFSQKDDFCHLRLGTEETTAPLK